MSSTELFEAASISMTSSEVARGDRHAGLARAARLASSAPARSSGRRRGSSPWTSCRSRASRRTGRRDGPCPARPRCAACARRAPGRPRRRRCGGGGGGRAKGPRARTANLAAASACAGPVASRPMQRLRPPAAIAAGALALWLVAALLPQLRHGLVAGVGRRAGGRRDAAAGRAFGAHAAPARHAAGRAAGAAGRRAPATPRRCWCSALWRRLVWLAFALGRAWFGRAAGWIAAALALTSVPLLTPAARAYLDVPYLALVLGALLVETRRRRAGAPVLALLAVAGLWRPEAWLFSAGVLGVGGARAPARRGGAARARSPPPRRRRGCSATSSSRATRCTRSPGPASRRPRWAARAGPARCRAALPDKLAHAVGPARADRRDRRARRCCCASGRAPAAGLAAAALGASLATAAGLTAAGHAGRRALPAGAARPAHRPGRRRRRGGGRGRSGRGRRHRRPRRGWPRSR